MTIVDCRFKEKQKRRNFAAPATQIVEQGYSQINAEKDKGRKNSIHRKGAEYAKETKETRPVPNSMFGRGREK